VVTYALILPQILPARSRIQTIPQMSIVKPTMVLIWQNLPAGESMPFSVYIANVCSLKKTPPWSSKTCRTMSRSARRHPVTTRQRGPNVRNPLRRERLASVATIQINQPYSTRSAPSVKWWLQTRFASVATLLPAPKAVTSSKGQHQLPRRLGTAMSTAVAKPPTAEVPVPAARGVASRSARPGSAALAESGALGSKGSRSPSARGGCQPDGPQELAPQSPDEDNDGVLKYLPRALVTASTSAADTQPSAIHARDVNCALVPPQWATVSARITERTWSMEKASGP